MNKIRIYATYKPVEKQWGGANNFIRALYKNISDDGRFDFVESIEDDFDLLFMNQFSEGPANNSQKLNLKKLKELIISKKKRPKIVVRAINLNLHAYRPGIRGLWSAFYKDFQTVHFLNNADFVIFQSEYQRSFFKKAGYKGRNNVVIHNGADSQFVNNSPHPVLGNKIRIISSIASGRWLKKLDLLASLSQQSNTEVLHAGLWPDDIPKKNVTLLGMMDKSQLIELYRTAHYFAHPAVKDVCPNSIFEAICSGLPVLYNPGIGSSSEIVMKCGLPLDEKNLDRLIETARLRYPELTAEVSRCKEYYTITRAAEQYKETLCKIASSS